MWCTGLDSRIKSRKYVYLFYETRLHKKFFKLEESSGLVPMTADRCRVLTLCEETLGLWYDDPKAFMKDHRKASENLRETKGSLPSSCMEGGGTV